MVKQALRDKESNDIKEETTTDTVKIFIDLKFSSNTGNRIVKDCIKKLHKCFKKEVKKEVCALLSNYQTFLLYQYLRQNIVPKPVVSYLQVCLPRM